MSHEPWLQRVDNVETSPVQHRSRRSESDPRRRGSALYSHVASGPNTKILESRRRGGTQLNPSRPVDFRAENISQCGHPSHTYEGRHGELATARIEKRGRLVYPGLGQVRCWRSSWPR